MGVYFDYFRAEDDDRATQTRTLLGGPLAGVAGFDGVSTKGLFPAPHLAQLVALAEGVPYERGPAVTSRLWPPPDTPPPADESSPWLTDPSVEKLVSRVTDTLAGIDQARVPGLGIAWGHELVDFSPDEATGVLTELAGLARRAQVAGQAIYCWSSL